MATVPRQLNMTQEDFDRFYEVHPATGESRLRRGPALIQGMDFTKQLAEYVASSPSHQQYEFTEVNVPMVTALDARCFICIHYMKTIQKTAQLVVIVSAKEFSGPFCGPRLWYHVSCSIKNKQNRYFKIPWEVLVAVKECFVGPHFESIVKIPKADEYVNDNEVLHLWTCLDGPVTPDFRVEDNMIFDKKSGKVVPVPKRLSI